MSFADVFQLYINNPSLCKDVLVYDDEKVLIIKDKFPKSLRHFLIIPKSSTVTHVHPLEVFQKNPKLYDIMSDYVQWTKQHIVEELLEKELIQESDFQEFKESFIQDGIHSVPSMSNLHIHVMTKDFNSLKMKNKKHYNSFNTLFFVPFDNLNPLVANYNQTHNTSGTDTEYSESDLVNTEYSSSSEISLNIATKALHFERDPKVLQNIIKSTPLKCSYCGVSFGNQFSKLKQHLYLEFKKKFDTTKDTSPNGMSW